MGGKRGKKERDREKKGVKQKEGLEKKIFFHFIFFLGRSRRRRRRLPLFFCKPFHEM